MTAGNSSPLSDGASAVVLASPGARAARGRAARTRARLGDLRARPAVMGIAPAFAMPKALARAARHHQQIDVWEVHEAFSAQALGVLRELPNQLDGFEVPDEKLNPNGGAVAIGHPFGSSGTRYVLTLATELARARTSLRRARRVRRLRPGRGPGARKSARRIALVQQSPA